MGYFFQLAARALLYAPSYRQDSTYHNLWYPSCGTLDGTGYRERGNVSLLHGLLFLAEMRNNSWVHHQRSDNPLHNEWSTMELHYFIKYFAVLGTRQNKRGVVLFPHLRLGFVSNCQIVNECL